MIDRKNLTFTSRFSISKRLLLLIIYDAMIIFACLKPKLPELPSPITRMDLVYHISAYSVLGILKGFFKLSSRNWFLLFFSQGVLIEFIQPYFSRNFELMDILFNSLGLILGMLLINNLNKFYFSSKP